jgi:hypothetical protein
VSGAGLAATLAASFLLGHELSRRFWKDALGWGERALVVALTGWALWLASTWALALLHLLTRPVLIGRTAIMGAAGLALLLMRLRSVEWREITISMPVVSAIAIALVVVPLFIWTDFSFWRGAVTPPASIDALSYHLPKAVLFARAEGYEALRDVRFLIGWRPCNYELLLADAIVMDGTDSATEWISTCFYLSFVLAAIALAQRWNGRGLFASLTAALLTAGVPVALLHATDYKNDVMAAFFGIASLVMLGRWLTERDSRALALAIVAIACAAGTKTPGAIFAALAIPFIVWRARLVRTAVVGIVVFVLLGGMAYVTRLADRSFTIIEGTAPASYSALSFGHFENLWKGPYVLIAESFEKNPSLVHVPWSSRPWLWQRYELYYSELGIAFSLCAIALPFMIWRGWRDREKSAMTALAFLAFAAILPFDSLPAGRYLLGLPRVALTIVPVVFAWTAVPLAAWLERRKRTDVALAVVLALSASFVWYAAQNAMHDSFAPFEFVIDASEHPGTRLPPIGHLRAAAVLDQTAGPADVVAFDGGVSSQLHLAYGARLTRPVHLIPPGTGAPSIPADAQWVVVDRVWNLVWGNEQMRDLGSPEFLRRGKPTEEDLRVMRAMLADKRFEPAFLNLATMQGVFRRRPGTPPASAPRSVAR